MPRDRGTPGAGRRRRAQRTGASGMGLSITPMIDVVFQLLIYFLLTAGLMGQERLLRGELPSGESEARAADPFALEEEPLVVRVGSGPDGAVLTLSGGFAAPADMAALEQFLRDARLDASRPDGLFPQDHPIRIAPEADALWEHVVAAFNAAVAAGYRSIAFGRST